MRLSSSRVAFVTAFFLLSIAVTSFALADTATTTITITPPEACADGLDNDFDGFIDYPSDPGCSSGGDSDETDPVPPQCADGADNDLDTLIDYPADSGCDSLMDDDELDMPPVSPGGGASSFLRSALSPTVSFSGLAFPDATISVLRDGAVYANTKADNLGVFSVNGTTLTPGSYVFTVIARQGAFRSTVSFLSDIVRASKVALDSIFLPPTVAISSPTKGNFRVSGLTVPFATLSIVQSGGDLLGETLAGADGSFAFDFTPAESTAVAVLAQSNGDTSTLSPLVRGIFQPPAGRGDLNGDGHVDLVDFSILVFWYEKTGVPASIDLSGDGTVTLADISIMLFYWTG